MIPTDLVAINSLSGYETFDHYFVSKCGHIWSSKKPDKFIKLKDGLVKTNKAVWIYDRYRKRKCILVANIVAKAFIPNLTNSYRVAFKSEDRMDCSVSNLSWEREKKIKEKVGKDIDVLMLDEELIKEFKKLYKAMKIKGYPVPTDTEFINDMLRTAIDAYINKYGLRRILHQMDNE